jgi:hypothetical protein
MHLKGQERNGGHNMSEHEAALVAKDAARGPLITSVPRHPSLPEALRAQAVIPETPIRLPDDPYAAFLSEVFRSMVRNKRLPKYQFERRLDAFLNIFLPEILSNLFGWHVQIVAPEFPLKKVASNQSTNVDCLLFRSMGGTGQDPAWIFFELKTDQSSVRLPQFDTYFAAMQRGMPTLRQELQQIVDATKHRAKYAELVQRLKQFPLEWPIELVYLVPSEFAARTTDPKIHIISFSQLQEMRMHQYPEAWELFRSIIIPALTAS